MYFSVRTNLMGQILLWNNDSIFNIILYLYKFIRTTLDVNWVIRNEKAMTSVALSMCFIIQITIFITWKGCLLMSTYFCSSSETLIEHTFYRQIHAKEVWVKV